MVSISEITNQLSEVPRIPRSLYYSVMWLGQPYQMPFARSMNTPTVMFKSSIDLLTSSISARHTDSPGLKLNWLLCKIECQVSCLILNLVLIS